MSAWEFRQWIESSYPWWLPYALALALLGGSWVWFAVGESFQEWRRRKRWLSRQACGGKDG